MPDLRELRRRIRAHVRHAALADDRRHDHDVARPLPAEHRQRGARGIVGAHVVDVHQLRASAPARCRRSRRRCRSRRCTSSRRGGRTVRRRSATSRSMSSSRVTSATTGTRLAAGRADLGGDRVELVRPPRTDDERVAVARQPHRRRPSDARRRAGNRDRLASPQLTPSSARSTRCRPVVASVD